MAVEEKMVSNVTDFYQGEAMREWSTVTLFCLYMISSVVGLCGSVLIVFTLISDKKFHQETASYTVYLSNLVATDLFFQLYFFPTLAAGLLAGRYPVFDHAHCVVNGFGLFACSIVFMFTLVAISCDRYVFICHKVTYQKYISRKSSTGICLVMWLVGGLVCIPSAVDGTIGFDGKTHMCFLQHQGVFTIGHGLTITVVTVTLVSVAIPNTLIYHAYHASRRRVRHHRSVHHLEGTSTSQYSVLVVSRNDIALLRSLLTVFLAFFLLTFPATVLFLIRSSIYVSPFLYRLFIWLYAVNSSINWVIYGLMNPRFHNGYRRAVDKVGACCKNA